MFKFLFKLFALVLFVAALWLGYVLLLPTGPTVEKFVMFRPGSSVRGIATDLKNAGLIQSRTGFLILHAFKMRSLKAGEYRFDHPANALEVYDRLARGDIYVHTVVIPEGYNIWDIAGVMERTGLMTRQDFLRVAQTELALIRDLDPQAKSLEGYLFPDTYHFTRTQTPAEMAAAMVNRFREEAKAIGLNGNYKAIVTMASIVEKESGAPDERPLVASVYYNRLQKGWQLAADPTLIYAALLNNRYDGVINQSDIEYDSPYNTYKYAKLPPGPIANPGRASLEAAMRPAVSDYMFFVSDNNGRHRFARTGDEHARNVAAYRRAVAAQGAR